MSIIRRMVRMGLVLTILSSAGQSPGQILTHDWSLGFGGTHQDIGMGVVVGGDGNVIVVGYFYDMMDIGGETLTGDGSEDIFLAKFDETGMYLWSMNIGSSGTDHGWKVAVDGEGNIFITGSAPGIVHIGGEELAGAGGKDILLVKVDGNGTHIWSRLFGGIADDVGLGIAVDDSGNVCICGFFRYAVDFGGGPLTSSGYDDIFVAKFDSEGSHLWSRSFGSPTGYDGASSCAMDKGGHVLLTGSFGSHVDFGGGPINSNGADDVFVAKFDSSGNHVWSTHCGGSSWDRGIDIAADELGSVLVTGNFNGAANFGGETFVSAGYDDIFMVKYDDTGGYQWGKRFGDTFTDMGFSIDTDSSGNVYATGYITGMVDFGGGALAGRGGQEIFIASFTPSGAHRWSEIYGDADSDNGYGIAVDGAGNALATGCFRSTVNFGGDTLTSAGSEDIYVARFTSAQVPVALQAFDACWMEDHVEITWELIDLSGELAFDISRASGVKGSFERIRNPEVFQQNNYFFFTDYHIELGHAYRYHIVIFEKGNAVAAFDVEVATPLPAMSLSQNYPNPFHPATRIDFCLDRTVPVTLGVYDVEGKLMRTLVSRIMGPGPHSADWDGRNDRGKQVAGGVYFYRLTAGEKTLARKAVFLK